MQIIKGFVTISQYVNNIPGQTALLGELSTWASTFTKELGEYQTSSIPGYKLEAFRSIDYNTGTPDIIANNQVIQILDLVRQSVAYATSHIRPYDPLDFKNNLINLFYGKISSLELGDFVDNGNIALPDWISWVSDEYNGNIIKVWLSDQSFINQYDEFEIVIVPPIEPIDSFFDSYNSVLTQLSQVTTKDLIDKATLAKDNNPETYLRIEQFNYVNPANASQITSVDWAAIIYGKAGDNIDLIKDKFIEYIMANSAHTREEWANIFPDIFKRTEFILVPRWDKMSVPNLTLLSGLYSSILNTKETVDFVKTNFPLYDAGYMSDNISIVPYDYKAITLAIVNGPENDINKQTIQQIFPDYIPVPSTSLDFNRISEFTRDWMLILEQLLISAEAVNAYNGIPSEFRKTYRNGILFVSYLYDNVNYLVAARSNSFYGY